MSDRLIGLEQSVAELREQVRRLLEHTGLEKAPPPPKGPPRIPNPLADLVG